MYRGSDFTVRRVPSGVAAVVYAHAVPAGVQFRAYAFEAIARYLGAYGDEAANASAAAVPLAAPVVTSPRGKEHPILRALSPQQAHESDTVAVLLSRKYPSVDCAPKPNNPLVTIVPTPERYVAVLRLPSTVQDISTSDDAARRLRSAVEQDGFAVIGPYMLVHTAGMWRVTDEIHLPIAQSNRFSP